MAWSPGTQAIAFLNAIQGVALIGTLFEASAEKARSQKLISFLAGPPKGGTATGPFVATL